MQKLAGENEALRDQAIQTLRAIPIEESGKDIVEGLGSPSFRVVTFAKGFLRFQGQKAVPYLIQGLRSPKLRTRETSIALLVEFKEKALPALDTLGRLIAEDESPHIRRYAMTAIGDILETQHLNAIQISNSVYANIGRILEESEDDVLLENAIIACGKAGINGLFCRKPLKKLHKIKKRDFGEQSTHRSMTQILAAKKKARQIARENALQ